MQEIIPNNLARLTNQIVRVCAYFSNFHPALVPPPELTPEYDVETYFDTNVDSDDFSSDASEDVSYNCNKNIFRLQTGNPNHEVG